MIDGNYFKYINFIIVAIVFFIHWLEYKNSSKCFEDKYKMVWVDTVTGVKKEKKNK